MATFHINALQFYDWQWRHDTPLAGTVEHPSSSWQDVAGRTNYRATVLGLIDAAHRLGMQAFAYNLLYGAWADYVQRGISPAWALYPSPGAATPISYALPAGWETPYLVVLNPANRSWQSYLFRHERAMFQAYPFDGWQVDQLGNLGATYTASGTYVYLPGTFGPFLQAASRTLHRLLIFNAVGTYGLFHVANEPGLAALYVECWPSSGQVAYPDLQGVIDEARAASGYHKSVVLAAYLDSTKAAGFSANHPGYFNDPGVLYADAVIFASGGDHIELGDQLNLLDAPYFPNHDLIMGSRLRADLYNYYNVLVAYESLLRGADTQPRPCAPRITGVAVSDAGIPGTVWAFCRSGLNFNTLQLINFDRLTTGFWQDSTGSAPAPRPLGPLPVVWAVAHRPDALYWASPDYQGGMPHRISYTATRVRHGWALHFRLPKLLYWDFVYGHVSSHDS